MIGIIISENVDNYGRPLNWKMLILKCTALKEKNEAETVEPFSCLQDGPHLGTILAPLCKVVPLSTKLWSDALFFFSNMMLQLIEC